MPFVLLLFIAMPIIEIAVLLKIGSLIGWLTTLAIVILTAILGTAMLRQQGLATLNTARSRLQSGELPAEQLFEGLLLVVGGVLLLTPGFVTDAFGFACLIPFTRRWLARRIGQRASVGVGGFSTGGFTATSRTGGSTVGSGATQAAQAVNSSPIDSGIQAGGTPTPQTTGKSAKDDIVDGEFRPVDD